MTTVIWVVGTIHVLVSLGLIGAILLHSGKGTGLSNAFGGGLPSTFAGTSIIERNLDRITVGLGITFGITSFALMLLLRGTAK
jgi:preprotein translocase subunit SecG